MENHHVYVRQIIKHPLFYGSWLPYSFVKWPEGIYKYKEMQMNEVQFSDMTRFWSSEQILKHVGFPRPISVGSGQWSGWELDVHHGQCSGWELDIHWVWVSSAAFSEGNQTWGGLMCFISRYLKENVSVWAFSSYMFSYLPACQA